MQTPQYEDGVYFDLPEHDYHRIAALSSTGIKNLLISPVDFWARSWMNPRYSHEETDAQEAGSAYHRRVLEGSEVFYQHYAPTFGTNGLPETADQLRLALKRSGHDQSGKKQDLIARCERFGIPTFDVQSVEYYAEHEGKIFLPLDLVESIEISAAMIEKSPYMSRFFKGGYPEITILWTHDGVRFKARLDYLKARAVIDLKTFENRGMKSVDKCVYTTMASYKYHIQAVFYLRALDAAKDLIRRELIFSLGEKVEYFRSEDFKKKADFIEKLNETEVHDFYFVFQQKGIAPFARGYKFPRTTMWSVGGVQIDAGIQTYKENLEKFGNEQWIDCSEIETLEDEGFPVWATSDL